MESMLRNKFLFGCNYVFFFKSRKFSNEPCKISLKIVLQNNEHIRNSLFCLQFREATVCHY